jgi:hypothetical protein
VCIRIWCWFMIDFEKVHSSTCWKGGGRWSIADPALFSLAGLRSGIFLLSSGKKKVRGEKKVERQVAQKGP